MSEPERPAAATAGSSAPPRSTRIAAVVGSAALLLGAAFVELMSLLILGFRCDESCDEGSGQWDDNPDAWQWDLQFAWATVGLGLAVATLSFAVVGRLRAAAYAFVGTLVTYASWWAFLSSS